MTRYTVDVKAFVNITVEAENEDDARKVADAFVENAMYASVEGVWAYNQGLPKDTVGTVVPDEYSLSVDGESDVDEDWMHDGEEENS